MKGRKPTLQADPNAITADMQPPEWLNRFAKEEWSRCMPELAARRILTVADLASFESFCCAIASVRLFDMLALKKGINEIDYKALRLRNQSMLIARQLAAELGLTPVSRSRPTVRNTNPEGDDDDNPLAVV